RCGQIFCTRPGPTVTVSCQARTQPEANHPACAAEQARPSATVTSPSLGRRAVRSVAGSRILGRQSSWQPEVLQHAVVEPGYGRDSVACHFAERGWGSPRRGVLERMLILCRRHLETVLAEYVIPTPPPSHTRGSSSADPVSRLT